jgi:hypothetical protein
MDIPDDVVKTFIDTFGAYTACDVGPALTCTEVDALYDLLTAMDSPDLAEMWVDGHAEGDEPDDLHYRPDTDDGNQHEGETT